MPRLFVAVWPPEEALEALTALARPDVPGLRWTGRDQWHVTLRFLGRVDEVEPVAAALAAIEGGSRADAVLGPAVGRFGQRVLHVPVDGLEAVAAAASRATEGLGRPEDRPFNGHLTLARARRGGGVDLRPLTGSPLAARWRAEAVCLVESRLSSTGSRYQVLEQFPLG